MLSSMRLCVSKLCHFLHCQLPLKHFFVLILYENSVKAVYVTGGCCLCCAAVDGVYARHCLCDPGRSAYLTLLVTIHCILKSIGDIFSIGAFWVKDECF